MEKTGNFIRGNRAIGIDESDPVMLRCRALPTRADGSALATVLREAERFEQARVLRAQSCGEVGEMALLIGAGAIIDDEHVRSERGAVEVREEFGEERGKALALTKSWNY